jgi:hypothetical protein
MTSNLTRFVLDIVGVLLGREGTAVAQARRRAARTWPAIVGFVVGAALGAAWFAAAGLASLALPVGLACWPWPSAWVRPLTGARRPAHPPEPEQLRGRPGLAVTADATTAWP